MRAGQPMPERIANAPELQLGLELYLQAFLDLDCERSHGNGLMPIPWTSVAEYARAFDFDNEQMEDLFYFIKKIDAEHLKVLSEKQKASSKNGKRFTKPR